MLRLLALFLSLLSPVAYQEITAEVKETVRDERGGYLMVEEEDRFFLKKDDSSWRVELPKAEEWLAVLKEGNYLYLHASDAGWQAEEYNPQGKPVHSGTLIAEPLTLNCALYSEGLILVGGISAYRGEPFISGRGIEMARMRSSSVSVRTTNWRTFGFSEVTGMKVFIGSSPGRTVSSRWGGRIRKAGAISETAGKPRMRCSSRN